MDTLKYISYEIVENCNLNCKNCCHFSQFKSKNEKSIEKIEEDLRRICNKFHIESFKVIGGEPLLHPNVVNILSLVRKIVGNKTNLEITTNGIKLLSMDVSFFLALKYLKYFINVSKYDTNINYEKIEHKLEEYQIGHRMMDKTEFNKLLHLPGNYNSQESFTLCKDAELACTIYDGKDIHVCSYAMSVPFLNEKFKYKIESNSISINETAEKIESYLNSPCSTCKFCHSTRKPEVWGVENEK